MRKVIATIAVMAVIAPASASAANPPVRPVLHMIEDRIANCTGARSETLPCFTRRAVIKARRTNR